MPCPVGRCMDDTAPSPSASTSSACIRAASAAEPSASAMTMKPGAAGSSPVERAGRARERLAVEELDRGRADAAADDAEDRLAARSGVPVERGDRQRDLGRGDQPQPGRGDDAERALGADQQALQVVAGHVLADRARRRSRARRARRPPRGPSPKCRSRRTCRRAARPRSWRCCRRSATARRRRGRERT